ncbi:MAG: T9SS type A sorting domain-containing protein, partial [Bacteroidetes bacterium]|nr:T9SS type A sorting domain-containing protein [Bacteroidota bacterium]
MFITHYDSVGVCFGVRNFSNAEGHIVTMDMNDFPIISGVFNDTINIGLNSISSYGMQDVFIAKCDAITGNMENKPPNNQLLIYANPTQGKCNITIPDEFANEKQLTLTVYDNIGRVIQVQTITMHEGKIKLNLTAEAKGMYHVSL